MRPGVVGHYFRQSMLTEVVDVLPTIRTETLFVHRTGDRVVPVESAREAAEDTDIAGVHEARLRRLAAVYVPVLAAGAWLSLRHRVSARPGGNPTRDLPLRGTAYAPPLFLPAALLGAAALGPRPDAAGATATTIAGLVGLAFTAGSTLNLANDISATRAAAAPVRLTVGIAAFHWAFGPTLTVSSFLALRQRRQARRPPSSRARVIALGRSRRQ